MISVREKIEIKPMKIILVCSLSDKADTAPLSGKTASAAYTFYGSPRPEALKTLRQEFGEAELQIAEALNEGGPEDSASLICFLDEVETRDADCVLISHPEKIKLLLSLLRKRGYLIEKPRLFGIRPLDRIRASKKSLHCGGCQHNCLLSEAKCHIGQDKNHLRKKP